MIRKLMRRGVPARVASFMVFVLAMTAAFAARAATADFDAALADLGASAGDDVSRGIQTLAASGDPRALHILEALRDGDLLVADGGHAYLRASDGTLHDA